MISNKVLDEAARRIVEKFHPRRSSFSALRRQAGYIIISECSKAFDDPGKFIEIPFVNKIRPRVKAWRESGYPGLTGMTKRKILEKAGEA